VNTSSTVRVLVVDDSVVSRDTLVAALSSFPSVDVVSVAENAAEAMAAFDRLRPDVTILDLAMPGDENGLDVLRRIKLTEARALVVVLTGYAEQEERCLAAGADTFLHKPFDEAALRTAVLAGRRPEAHDHR
jgi:CheY-like chemotaxis protein